MLPLRKRRKTSGEGSVSSADKGKWCACSEAQPMQGDVCGFLLSSTGLASPGDRSGEDVCVPSRGEAESRHVLG